MLAAAVLAQDQALRSFLVGPDGPAMAWLAMQDLTGEPRTFDEARDATTLAAGYHVVDLVGTTPPVRYVAMVPRAPAPTVTGPRIWAPAPTMTPSSRVGWRFLFIWKELSTAGAIPPRVTAC